ncbi:MAG: hypothetical protein V3U34_00725 [candidate division NC10 bacterium]
MSQGKSIDYKKQEGDVAHTRIRSGKSTASFQAKLDKPSPRRTYISKGDSATRDRDLGKDGGRT